MTTGEDAIIELLDAAKAAGDLNADIIVIGHGDRNYAVIWGGQKVDPWKTGADVLSSLATWALPEGMHVTVTVVKGQLVTIFKLILYPGNRQAIDLRAAYLDAKAHLTPAVQSA